jgi:small subunit ribosomal protein S21
VVRKDEPIEKALRRFKRMCDHAGIRKIVRLKRFYEKPSDARRRELRKRIRNQRRAERKAAQRNQRKARKVQARLRSRSMAFSAPPPQSATPKTEQVVAGQTAE